jgi:hypothetical protein
MDAARARTRHQVEARCFDQVQPFPKGTQQPVDSSGVLAFIAGGDVSPKKRGRRQQARKRTDFVWRGEEFSSAWVFPLSSVATPDDRIPRSASVRRQAAENSTLIQPSAI